MKCNWKKVKIMLNVKKKKRKRKHMQYKHANLTGINVAEESPRTQSAMAVGLQRAKSYH